MIRAALIATMIAGGVAQSAYSADFGSGTTTQIRSCNAVPCNLGPKTVLLNYSQSFQYSGLSADLNLADNRAFTDVSFSSSLYFPTIKSLVISEAARQSVSFTHAFQEFTWTGSESIQFGVTGFINYTASGRFDVDGDGSADDGSGSLQATMILYDPALYPVLSRIDIISNFFEFGSISNNGTNTGGTLTLNTLNVIGDWMTLAPGMRIGVGILFDLSAVSGGFADSAHTFTVSLDPNLSDQTQAALRASLRPDGQISAVPEPDTWMMLIAGFGAIGAVRRLSQHRSDLMKLRHSVDPLGLQPSNA